MDVEVWLRGSPGLEACLRPFFELGGPPAVDRTSPGLLSAVQELR